MLAEHTLNIEAIRRDFPILSRQINGKPLVYLDNAATTQKPRQVIEALVRYYETNNANVHRGLHTLAEEATDLYEGARQTVASFLNAKQPESIVFLRNTTEAINLIAYAWARQNIKPGDVIVLSQMEHHANLVPWQQAAAMTGAQLRWVTLTEDGKLDLSSLEAALKAGNVKLVAMSHVSNVLGTINPITDVVKLAHEYGALAAIDGAQAVPHLAVDVQALDVDFYSVSAHKMLGPTGIGALYGKLEILESMEPFLTGGSMIGRVTLEKTTWAEVPQRFEAGTPNVADAVGWGAAIDYLNALGMDNVFAHEQAIGAYAMEKMQTLPGIKLYGPRQADERVGVISFNLGDVHPHDVAHLLNDQGIAVRAGHHCCAPLMKLLNAQATARASFYLYNKNEEADALVEALGSIQQFFASQR